MQLRTFVSTTEPPVGVRRSTTYLPEIESLRGIAMLLVFVFHLNPRIMAIARATEARDVSPLLAFVGAGHTGVTLFFVLSGFLLSLPFLAEAAGGPRVNRARYFQRRALRLFPLYFAAVIFATCMTARGFGDLRHALPYLFFLNSFPGPWKPMFPYAATWWSLATEVQYYVLLPILSLLLTSRLGRTLGVILLFAYAAAYVSFLLGGWHLRPGSEFMLKLSIFGRGPLFLLGIAVAWMYRRNGPRLRERFARITWLRWGGADALLLATLAAMSLLLQWQLSHGYAVPETVPYFAWHLIEGLLWATVLALVLLAPLRLKALFINPVVGHLGVLSYSMYLWHTSVILWVPRWLRITGWFPWEAGWNARSAVVAAAITGLSLAISQLTYTLIERPFLVRKARIE